MGTGRADVILSKAKDFQVREVLLAQNRCATHSVAEDTMYNFSLAGAGSEASY